MLTNAYYYNLYRPYIVGNRDRNTIVEKRSRIARTTPQEKLDRGMTIVLNKSLKQEIISYARNVSQGVTYFKSAVRMALADMGSFGLNAMYNGYESAIDSVEENLANLSAAYNSSTLFLEQQQQSRDLRSFSQILRERVYQGQDRLGLLGFSLGLESDSLQFDRTVLRSLSHIEMHAAIGANMQVLHGLHQSATAVLTSPLSSHMGFKGLNYHYNYKLGRMVEDGFGIIESGMIVDKVV